MIGYGRSFRIHFHRNGPPPSPCMRISVGSREYIIHLTSTSADYRGETSQPIPHGRIMRRFITILANNSQVATSCTGQRTSRFSLFRIATTGNRRRNYARSFSCGTWRSIMCSPLFFSSLETIRGAFISEWPCTCRDWFILADRLDSK